MSIKKNVFLGVDVGSGSVRAVAVDEKGSLLGSAVENLEINRPRQDYHEQSSEQIWKAICHAVSSFTYYYLRCLEFRLD